jgi:hypothetical protein
MSGYAANARLQGGSPRFVAAGGSRSGETFGGRRVAALPRSEIDERILVELVGQPLGERLASRWADLREAWAQTTFYLFDPESWR